jgi:ATP-binding cassette subfamily C protein/ATP-binding cassette subfamily C exporter for protease/lipase/ATP-binding cassette subfamily C protein EexD
MRTATPALKQRQQSELEQALRDCRSAFAIVMAFSLVMNVLMLASPVYMLQVYDRVLTTGHLETLALLTLIVGAAQGVMCALDFARMGVTIRIGCWLNDRLGPVLLGSSVRARLNGDTSGVQPLRDLSQVQSFIGGQGLTAFFDIPWIPVFLVLSWLLHPVFGLAALIASILLFLLSIGNELMTRSPTLAANLAQLAATQQADAAVRNAEVVRAMGMLPALIERWRESNASSVELLRRASERGGLIVTCTKFVRVFVQSAILGLGALLVLRGEVSPGAMIAASILLGRALAPVELAMGAWRNFTSTRIAYARLNKHLQTYAPEGERTRLPTPSGRISVDKLMFVAPGTASPILRQVSFDVEPGQVLAVLGPSAAGKSTLCRFLVGLVTPTSGTVRLDGSELAHWVPDQLGRFVGYLPQDVELFAGTIRDNIARMGNPDDNSVLEAAVLARAHDMIAHLPNGYETQIGERGARLSAGQRQRIGLARAVYGEPRLIVLDEPNANLDQAGEAALAAAIGELKARGAALVIVGHRPSTLARADKILWLNEGRVELFGPRDEVLQKLREAAAAVERSLPRRNGEAQAAPSGGAETARREGGAL